MPSLCSPFIYEASWDPSPPAVRPEVESSDPRNTRPWPPGQKKHVASTGGCAHMSIRLRPSTCLYNMSEDSSSTRRRWGRYNVEEACVWCYRVVSKMK